MTSTNRNNTFHHMRLMAAELASHIRDSLGPMGKRVIIVDDEGKVTITRSGIHILKSLRCSDPFAKMIVQAVDSHVTQYGDGGKTFVLLYSALLSSIAEKVNESDSSVLRNRLTEIRRGLMALRHLLSREEDDIRALFSMGTTMPLLEDKDAVKRLFAASLRSGAGVTGNVAQKLAGTLTEFLCASSDSGGLDSYHVENTIKNMAHLCIKEAGRSVESTRMSRGVLLSRPPVASRTAGLVNKCDHAKSSVGVLNESMTQTIANPTRTITTAAFSTQDFLHKTASSELSHACFSTAQTYVHPNETKSNCLSPGSQTLPLFTRLLLLSCPLTPSGKYEDDNESSYGWHLRCDNVSSLLTWRSHWLSALVGRLKSLRVTLVVTQCAVAPFELATLASSGISCVDHLPAEEMTWLADTFGCQVVQEVAEVMESENERFLVNFYSMDVVNLNGEDRVSLRFFDENSKNSSIDNIEDNDDTIYNDDTGYNGLDKKLPVDPWQLIVASSTHAACDAFVSQLRNCLLLLRPLFYFRNESTDDDEREKIESPSHSSSSAFRNAAIYDFLICGSGLFEVFLNVILRSRNFSPHNESPLIRGARSSTYETLWHPREKSEWKYQEGETEIVDESARYDALSSPRVDESRLFSARDNIPFASDLGSGVQIFTLALLEIPSAIHRNSASSKDGSSRLISVLNRMTKTLASPTQSRRMVGIDARTGELCCVGSEPDQKEFASNGDATTGRGSNTLSGQRKISHDDTELNCESLRQPIEDMTDKSGITTADPNDVDPIESDSASWEACGLETLDGKMAIVNGVLDFAILTLNVECVVPAGPKLIAHFKTSCDEDDDGE